MATLALLYSPTVSQGLGGGISSLDAKGREPGSTLWKSGEAHVGFGIRQDQFYWVWIASSDPLPDEPRDVSGAGFISSRVGWPMLALSSPPVDLSASRDYKEFRAAVKRSYALPTTEIVPAFARARSFRPLPTRILPLGFAVNTVMYAAVAGVLLFAPRLVRRGLRRRGGRCVGCGYPLTGGGRCPECGDAAPQGGEHRPLRAAVGGTVSDLPFAICRFAILEARL